MMMMMVRINQEIIYGLSICAEVGDIERPSTVKRTRNHVPVTKK